MAKGSWSAAKLNKKTMIVNALITMLALIVLSQLVPLQVYGVNVEITSILPETKTGKVGETVRVIGKINTTNGEYRILLGNVLVASGSASGNNVNCTFKVPLLPGGNYTLTLRDVAANTSATSWFRIETNYIVKVGKLPHPKQFQEGATGIVISLNITGGNANTVYAANITVKTPASETFWKLMHLNTIDNGVGNAALKYPEDFGGAHTNYTGTYVVSFNGTLSSDTFFVGLTDQSEYHRGDTVNIRAVDYSPLNGKNVTITIAFGDKVIESFNYTVSNGVVEANWIVPNHLLIGNYSLSIKPKPETKKVNDTQVFAIPGYKTEIFPCNLAGEPVPNVFIKVFDRWANTTYNVTSGGEGAATAMLEKGEYDYKAYFKKVRVGEASFTIPQEYGKLKLTCWLTNLNVTVVSGQNSAVKIPFVSLNLSVTYTIDLNSGGTENETIVSQTSIDGSAQFRSLILNASYKVAASRYGRTFNPNNDTISGLNPVGWNNITIICPVKQLQVEVTDFRHTPVSNALVKVHETIVGLCYEGYTSQEGLATFNCIFGVYHVRVYSKGILLNATTVELFEEKTVILRCFLYNLPIYIKVVDYFGQPIPNANVTLERDGVPVNSKRTGGNGMADFTEIGGTLTVKVYLVDQNQPTSTITLSIVEPRSETKPIVIKVGKYVVLASLLLETSWFATIILVAATAAFSIAIEILLRKRRLAAKASS